MAIFSKETFEKHQGVLLFCANTKWLRWLLGMNRLPKALRDKKFCQITPNALHWVKSVKDKNNPEFTGAFFTRPRFAEALAFSLSPLAYLQSGMKTFAFSPVGAFVLGLMIAYPRLSLLAFGVTDQIYVGSGDGRCEASGLWATIRAAASGTAYNGGTGGFDIASMSNYIDRTYWPTDTSSLPTSPTITAASLFIYANDGAGQNANSTTAELVLTGQATPTTLVNTDYGAITFTSGGSKTFASWTDAAYNEIAFNATGLTWISDSGYTKLGVITGRDLSNTAPTGNNWVSCRFSEQSGTSQDPYLTVTYTVASTKVVGTFIRQAVNRASTY